MSFSDCCVQNLGSPTLQVVATPDQEEVAHKHERVRGRWNPTKRTALLIWIDGELLFHNDREALLLGKYPGVKSWDDVCRAIAADDSVWKDETFCEIVSNYFGLSSKGLSPELRRQLCSALDDPRKTILDASDSSPKWLVVWNEMSPEEFARCSATVRAFVRCDPLLLLDAFKRSEKDVNCIFVAFEDETWTRILRGVISDERNL